MNIKGIINWNGILRQLIEYTDTLWLSVQVVATHKVWIEYGKSL
jgi:hypothetical protein